MREEAPRTALQTLQWHRTRLIGLKETAVELRGYFQDGELPEVIKNVNAAIQRIDNLTSQPKRRFVRKWSSL
jgi:hypothetical protein